MKSKEVIISIQTINDYIKKCNYTYTFESILETYRKYYKPGWYCSYTANDVIKNNLKHFELIDEYLIKNGKDL